MKTLVMRIYFFITLCCFFPVPLSQAYTWTNKQGKTVDAEWVRQEGDKVVMRNEEGREFRVPLVSLSHEDRIYANKMLEKGLEGKFRPWTLADGRVCNAILEKVDARFVTLVDKNGIRVRILLVNLAPEDKNYLLDKMKKGAVEFSKGESVSEINIITVDELCRAIEKGDEATFKSYVDNKGPLNMCDSSDTMTPLCSAAAHGQLEMAKRLLASGAKIDFKVRRGDQYTPLMCAAFRGHMELVKLLLSAGADVNVENEMGMTVLMDGISSGNIQIVKLLLAHGADVARKSRKTGVSALEYARKKNSSLEMIKLLEEMLLTQRIETPACKNGKLTDAYLKLLQEAMMLLRTVNWDDNRNKAELVEMLSEALMKVKTGKAEINTPCPPFKRYDAVFSPLPLECAAATGSRELVDQLIKLGAGTDHKSDFAGRTAFAILGEKNFDVIKCLMESGLVTIDMKHVYGNNLLIWASVADASAEIVQYLIDRGIDINAKNSFGATALMEAVQYKRLEIIRILLRNEADVRVKLNGLSALDKAKRNHAGVEIIRLLEEAESRQGETTVSKPLGYE